MSIAKSPNTNERKKEYQTNEILLGWLKGNPMKNEHRRSRRRRRNHEPANENTQQHNVNCTVSLYPEWMLMLRCICVRCSSFFFSRNCWIFGKLIYVNGQRSPYLLPIPYTLSFRTHSTLCLNHFFSQCIRCGMFLTHIQNQPKRITKHRLRMDTWRNLYVCVCVVNAERLKPLLRPICEQVLCPCVCVCCRWQRNSIYVERILIFTVVECFVSKYGFSRLLFLCALRPFTFTIQISKWLTVVRRGSVWIYFVFIYFSLIHCSLHFDL